MSLPRPDFIDLRSTSQASVLRPLRSPRLHVVGEAPPELSPLDAFAMQSRLLARQLEESQKQDRRISRLPPLTVESPLIVQGRSDYFRSFSQDSGSEQGESPGQENVGLGMNPDMEEASWNRHVSLHPRMSRIPPTPDDLMPLPFRSSRDTSRERPLDDIDEGDGFFDVDARRERSPSPMGSVAAPERESRSVVPEGIVLPLAQSSHSTESPEKIVKKSSFESTGLVPPRSLFPKRSSSILSFPLEPTGEEAPGSLGTAYYSHGPRKLSTTSSGMVSPGFAPYRRSPSVSSDASGFPRPSLNFSRPLSRAGTPGLETPARQTSSDSHTSFVLSDDTACTPISISSEAFPDFVVDDGKTAAPSYIYSRFSLPRGKVLQRTSALFLDGQPQAHFQWEQPPIIPPSNVQTYPLDGHAPPSPPTRPTSSAGSRAFEEPVPAPSLEPNMLSNEAVSPAPQTASSQSRLSVERGRQSESSPERRPRFEPFQEVMRGRTAVSTTTSDTASTVKPSSRSVHSKAPTVSDMTAEEHLTKGITLHENGSLNESTYHLRHAARGGHPTGMLLYALACRHGWGMRQNPREGVEWLRRAAESASLEIADDEDQSKEGKPVDAVERKTRKAQFALSIYELGVSHMNGWGIEQDKALALRCFEIAGAWGDVDALAEAGFCYAQGVGCKKNLKKSASLYRQAEAKGMSMIGNSWIHKSKYNTDDGNDSPISDKKRARSKSRTRKSIFGKKTTAS